MLNVVKGIHKDLEACVFKEKDGRYVISSKGVGVIACILVCFVILFNIIGLLDESDAASMIAGGIIVMSSVAYFWGRFQKVNQTDSNSQIFKELRAVQVEARELLASIRDEQENKDEEINHLESIIDKIANISERK
jgi:uncharacterized membrane protein YccC